MLATQATGRLAGDLVWLAVARAVSSRFGRVSSSDSSDSFQYPISRRSRGPFLERPGKLTGPVSYFEIEVSRKVGRVLTSNEVHFVSLAENFTDNFQKFWNSHLEWKTKQLNGPGNYRELQETGPRTRLAYLAQFTEFWEFTGVFLVSPTT